MLTSRRRKVERLDFILAGAQKSGTTALHYFLQKHADITLGDQQEMHFFDDEESFSRAIDYEILHRHFPPARFRAIAEVDADDPGQTGGGAIGNTIGHRRLLVSYGTDDRAFAHWAMQRFKGQSLDFIAAVSAETIESHNRSVWVLPSPSTGIYSGKQLLNSFREQLKIINLKSSETGGRKTPTPFAFSGKTTWSCAAR
jgi:hypothetical protein